MEMCVWMFGSSLGGGAKGTAVTFFPADAYTPDMIRMARAIGKAEIVRVRRQVQRQSVQAMRDVGLAPHGQTGIVEG